MEMLRKRTSYLGYDGQPFGSAQGRLFGTQQVASTRKRCKATKHWRATTAGLAESG